ncbi:hypothetical protein ATCC90586_006349 [Pythium insidiosum]|nr:hypothetical protein ATCC90586_006349 [Pythium insidiosum]
MERVDWDDEPPLLGDEAADDNQREHGDATIMDEMVAAAQQAKAAKRLQQERERASAGFGSGLKKGFFNKKTPKKSASTREVLDVPSDRSLRASDLRIVRDAAASNQDDGASERQSPFVFAEVQEAMKGMQQLNPNGPSRVWGHISQTEWMNEAFFEKLSRHPRLLHALKNPHFMAAIEELQRDPKGAILKYGKDPAVSAMLKDFMEFMGSHFEELGKAATTSEPSKRMQQTEVPAPSPPPIVDLEEVRRKAIAEMPRAPAEEEQVQRILSDPDLLAALSDASLMERVRRCQEDPSELQRLTRDPSAASKLRLLVAAGLSNMSLKEQVDSEMARYRALQEEVQVLASQRQQFAQQANENGMVKQELDLLDDDAKVYKLIGPVLLKQEVGDAKTNVKKRLEFINNELEKVSTKIEQKEKDAVEIRKSIAQMQMEMQRRAAEAARSVAAQ